MKKKPTVKKPVVRAKRIIGSTQTKKTDEPDTPVTAHLCGGKGEKAKTYDLTEKGTKALSVLAVKVGEAYVSTKARVAILLTEMVEVVKTDTGLKATTYQMVDGIVAYLKPHVSGKMRWKDSTTTVRLSEARKLAKLPQSPKKGTAKAKAGAKKKAKVKKPTTTTETESAIDKNVPAIVLTGNNDIHAVLLGDKVTIETKEELTGMFRSLLTSHDSKLVFAAFSEAVKSLNKEQKATLKVA